MKQALAIGALFTALATGSVMASEIDLGYRIGKVQAAEMSRAAMVVYDLDKSPCPVKFDKPCYIVVTVKLLKNRSVNIVDYKLSLGGEELSCVALARNNESFVVNAQTMYATGRDRIKLLFIADGAKFTDSGSSVSATLNTALPGRSYSVGIPVTDLGDKELTKAADIAEEGNF